MIARAASRGALERIDGADVRLRGSGFAHQPVSLAYSDHLQQAKTLARRAADWARQRARTESAALTARDALWDGFVGNATEARRNRTAALAVSRERDVEYGVALALAGDSAQSQTLTDDLER